MSEEQDGQGSRGKGRSHSYERERALSAKELGLLGPVPKAVSVGSGIQRDLVLSNTSSLNATLLQSGSNHAVGDHRYWSFDNDALSRVTTKRSGTKDDEPHLPLRYVDVFETLSAYARHSTTDEEHAALETSEVYMIQFDILRKATGLPFRLTVPQSYPRLYPTFESHLPLKWAVSQTAITLNPADLVSSPPPIRQPDQPDLICLFCKTEGRLKAYATPTGLWGHLFHKHTHVDPKDRLEEIRRTVSLWAEYWLHSGDDGGKGASTLEKLATAQKESFCWDDVIAMNFRR
ncbi:MAG: hypothetical protein Q9213_005466 [Squamulea squamosa]